MTKGAKIQASASDQEPESKPHDLLARTDATDIRWFDLSSGGDPDSLQRELVGQCDGLELSMLADLLNPDVGEPYGERWNDGAIRLVSTFAVYSPGQVPRSGWWCSKASATLIYQPVELLAGDGWLLTCWHPSETYRGSNPVDQPGEPRDSRDIVKAVLKKWTTPGARTAGDLGVLVMHELALTYAPGHRLLHAALEEQELSLYGNDAADPDDPRKSFQQVSEGLSDIWGARTLLYDRLSPLNIPGLRDNYEDRAWLPATDTDEIDRVDDQIDRSLENLSRLSDSLRTSFHNLRLLNADAHRDHREQRQRKIEILAAVFLIPTLIVGFYGANTWIPGEHEEWGFAVMVGCIVVLTSLAAWLIDQKHKKDDIRLSRLLKNPLRNHNADS